MKNGKLRIIGVALIMATMLMGTISKAQHGRHDGGNRGGGYGRGYENHAMNRSVNDLLELTEDQKGKIEEIKLASGKKTIQGQNKISELEAQLATSLTQDKVDNTKVNSLIDEIGKLKTENRKDRISAQLKIRELLTEKQKIIFDQHRSGRK
ncbi:MAG: Spy/CpxP family protein refolding chaperone [Cyclobacteriaceae bacterium]|nr:Spy/CpxP family protein refolding chaperone [Cyclobacteriaceae bacterium]